MALSWKPILGESGSTQTDLDALLSSQAKLGSGAFGEVDVVCAVEGVSMLARKRITVSRRKAAAARDIKFIEDEIENLKSLTHPHIVQLFGSYQANEGTWKHSYDLLMHPVGDDDLGSFLEDECKSIAINPESESSIMKSAWIMKWFTCLPSALAYMHSQFIRHEDIKPTNIVHKGQHIYFTDFSSSKRCKSAHATSTANPPRASRLYAAPEALPTADDSLSRHGSKTDVFSPGLEFVEMLTILESHDIDGLHGYLERNDGFGESSQSRQYHHAVDLMHDWFTSDQGHAFFTQCIKPMLNEERSSRPSAEEVVQLVNSQQPWGATMACPCKDTLGGSSPSLTNIAE